MTTRVDPGELRGAAKKLEPSGPYNAKTDGSAFTSASVGLSTLATASALRVSRQAADSAVGVVRARLEEWQSILTTSATEYKDSDVGAAQRLKGLGDLNQPPKGGSS
ncbi:type VII secretion target [Gordonia soli]|uniref:ESX-1 secretion-associated protein n=1 Tax=Gordonia soli NBRC 108243 TaxID=1223545 RepID=M0QEG8_9ACTN|nr:type VII secretion target [Gordonia soli]GAC66988.1 hypothetical protein GS4_05_02010 [Gordonia soli NBRC 108243]